MSPPSSVAPPRVLLVDDDPNLLRLLAIRLQASGYEITTAESGEAALSALAVAQPQLVITDLRMGGMDGLALFDAIHKAYSTLPVIILTAHGTIPDAVAATRRGAFGFLTKPYDSKELMEKVEQAVRLGGGLPPTIGGAGEVGWREEIITRSPLMEQLLSKARLVASSDASVFVSGPSGSGKELLARAIHKASPRADRPFVAVNCAAIPEPLLESELFGHVKGAFTGASRDHKGLIQAAHTGTLFLDEIGDMPLSLQAKLLRVLEDKQVRPVGSVASVPVDVRVVSATHRALAAYVADGRFREDLYYRLNVVMLDIPPLASRREDIPLLANHLLAQLAAKYSRPAKAFSPEALDLLIAAPWPGNVRQLHNVVEQIVALCPTTMVPASFVQAAIQSELQDYASFDIARGHFERDYLTQLLRITDGNVSRAAKLAQRNRTDFYKLLQRHQIDPALFKPPSS